MTEDIITQDEKATQETERTIPKIDKNLSLDTTYNELPIIKDEPGHIAFIWRGYRLLVDATHFDDKGRAELSFWYDDGETGRTQLLTQRQVNLLSSSNTGSLLRELRDGSVASYLYLPWDWVLTCITYQVIKTARHDEPILEIASNPDIVLTPDYLLTPILYRNHPNIIFGDYGSGKSLTALVCAFIVQLPYPDNKLGLAPSEKPCFCLYLDYEDEESSFTKRWTAIQRGFHVRDELDMTIFYKRMTASLIDSVEPLRQEIIDRHIGLLVVDSLGPAARGNLNDPEPAIQYHQALRALGVTSLTLAHNSKDLLTKKKSIFGSVFFSNLARSIWECKAEQEPIDNELTISLKQVKASLSERYSGFGYRYTFNNETNAIAIEKVDLRGTSLSGELPLLVQIKNLLRNGAMPVKEIAEALEANEGSVKVTVNRLAKKEVGGTVKMGDLWGLKEL